MPDPAMPSPEPAPAIWPTADVLRECATCGNLGDLDDAGECEPCAAICTECDGEGWVDEWVPPDQLRTRRVPCSACTHEVV